MIIIKYKDGLDYKKLNPFYQNIQFSQVIDQYGGFSFEYPATDTKASLLTNRGEIQIFEDDELLFSGTITNKEVKPADDVPMMTISGVELLEDFANEVTLPNILFQNEPYSDVLDPTYINTLIKPTTWATIVESTTEDLTYLSSMQTSLKTFQIVKRQIGFHFRYAGTLSAPRTVEFGKFGVNTPKRLRQLPSTATSVADDLLVIENGGLSQVQDSLSLINWVYPIGGGGDNGINQLTLRDVDPLIIDSDYPIFIDDGIPNSDTIYDPTVFANTKTGPNNYQAYYLKDTTSIAQYGSIKKPVSFNDIYPVAGAGAGINDNDRRSAANELYKASVQFLLTNKDPKVSYSVNCWGNTEVKVGDKINLKFKGEIKKLNSRSTSSTIWVDIQEDFYISGLTVSLVEDNIRRYSLTVSNILQFPESDLDVISGAVDSINDNGRQRRGSVSPYPVFYKDSFDSSYPAKFLFWVPPETVYTDYILMKVRLRNFRSYAKSAEAGGGSTLTSGGGGGIFTSTDDEGTGASAHQHSILVNETSSDRSTLELLGYKYIMVQPGGGGNISPCASVDIGLFWAPDSSGLGESIYGKTNCTINGHHHSFSLPPHTHSVTLPMHTHDLVYGIFEDATVPTNVKVYIDGVDYSTEIGVFNAFGDYPSTSNENFDILLAAQGVGELSNLLTPGAHEIEVKCDTGRAMVELFIYNQFFISSR